MDSRATPVATNESRLSHQKRLHFILFVDAAQTRSFSLKTRHAWWLFASIVLFFLTSVAVGISLVKTYKKLKATQSYLVDVKRELFAQSIAERNILNPEFIGGSYKNEKAELIQAIVDELGQIPSKPTVVAKKSGKETKKTEILEQNTADTSEQPTSAPAEEQPQQVVLPPTTTSATHTSAQTATKTLSAPVADDGSPIKFENVSISDDDDEPGTINISFDLQNVSGRMLTGWVCAAVLLKNSEGTSHMRAAPSSVSLEPNKQSIASCKGGEFVKFSRLRPTILSTSGTQSGVERVVVYFTDGTSGRQYAHRSSN